MKKDSEISKMFQYAGNRHWLTIFQKICRKNVVKSRKTSAKASEKSL